MPLHLHYISYNIGKTRPPNEDTGKEDSDRLKERPVNMIINGAASRFDDKEGRDHMTIRRGE